MAGEDAKADACDAGKPATRANPRGVAGCGALNPHTSNLQLPSTETTNSITRRPGPNQEPISVATL